MSSSHTDVAIIGAGPYGLSIAAHLHARGVNFRIFGEPMRIWRNMPSGMYLKSFDFATNIYTPRPHYTFREYHEAQGVHVSEPIEIALFAKYGVWAQQQLVPNVEEVDVMEVASEGAGFRVTLTTGEQFHAQRVVVATGLSAFEQLPPVFQGLPQALVSHTSQHSDFSPFAGRDVAVIGGGQSALQAAALLHEQGAQVRMLVRNGVWFSGKMPERRPLIDKLKYPQSVLGPGRENWVLQHVPMALHYVPTERRVPFVHKHLGPMGAWWLRDRVEGLFPIHERTIVTSATPVDNGVRLRLRDAEGEREIETQHVIAGTGFEVNIDRLPFLNPALAAEVARVPATLAPDLSRHFESSVRGLYFVGPSSAFSFGPLFRFIAGAAYAAPVVARRLASARVRSAAAAIPIREPVTAEAQPTLVASAIER